MANNQQVKHPPDAEDGRDQMNNDDIKFDSIYHLHVIELLATTNQIRRFLSNVAWNQTILSCSYNSVSER